MRKIVFAKPASAAVIIAVVTFFLLNAVAGIVLSYKGINLYDSTVYEQYKQRMLIRGADSSLGGPSIVHPFFGKLEFGGPVFESKLSSEPLFIRVDKSASKNDVKVLILGGSVAAQTTFKSPNNEEGAFAKLLSQRFNTEKFSVYNAAFGGGKQPAQYFKLVYLDLLGFKPDIVINIDGFNEIALPLAENYPIGNPAIFPRLFSAHVDSTSSQARECIPLSNNLVSRGSLLPLVALAVHVYAENCKSNIERRDRIAWWSDLLPPGDFDAYVRKLSDIWRDSSNKMYHFTLARGIPYIHVLQPNQYYADSKVFSEEEKANALSYPAYGDPIRRFYSTLSNEGLETKNFHDQRMLFKDTRMTLYIDWCCHLNRAGNEMIINDIIEKFYPIFREKLRQAEENALSADGKGGAPPVGRGARHGQ